MQINKTQLIVALALSATILFSCDKKENESQDTNTNNANANVVSDDASVNGYEIPKLDAHYDYICHKLPNGDVNFALEYDKAHMHPRWVAYTYNIKNAQKNAPTRTNAWNPDPFYNNQKQYQVDVQNFTGYSRGHLVGSAERYYSTEANEQTFYMTNMSPQNSTFNADYWGEIEDKARDIWGRGVINQSSTFYEGTLYITKGGTINTEENILDYINVRNTQGEVVRMAVPKYYFMACLFVAKNGDAKAIGFWMEHKDYHLNTQDATAMQTFRRNAVCTVDELEQRTGIDFFCNLTDAVENAVESTCDISLWPGL